MRAATDANWIQMYICRLNGSTVVLITVHIFQDNNLPSLVAVNKNVMLLLTFIFGEFLHKSRCDARFGNCMYIMPMLGKINRTNMTHSP